MSESADGTTDDQRSAAQRGPEAGLEPAAGMDLERPNPMPFDGLVAPLPSDASPPTPARWLAFTGVLVGGLLGGLIGYGIGNILGGSPTWAAVGAAIAGIGCAVGVGIVASLTLRAMNEWKVSVHPEDPRRADGQT